MFNSNKEPEMTKIARTFNKAGIQLMKESETNILSGTNIKRRAERIGGYQKNSILPSDYCYNIINKATYSCKTPLFIWLEKNQYKYIGPYYSYSGPLIWRRSDGTEKQVGMWNKGILTMNEDPRK